MLSCCSLCVDLIFQCVRLFCCVIAGAFAVAFVVVCGFDTVVCGCVCCVCVLVLFVVRWFCLLPLFCCAFVFVVVAFCVCVSVCS